MSNYISKSFTNEEIENELVIKFKEIQELYKKAKELYPNMTAYNARITESSIFGYSIDEREDYSSTDDGKSFYHYFQISESL